MIEEMKMFRHCWTMGGGHTILLLNCNSWYIGCDKYVVFFALSKLKDYNAYVKRFALSKRSVATVDVYTKSLP